MKLIFVDVILKEFFFDRREKNLVDMLQKLIVDGERTLFILDGLDEVSFTLDPDSSPGRVLDRLLARPNVIITSRPTQYSHT